MPKPTLHPSDPPCPAPAAGPLAPLERLSLPGALLLHAWSPFRFAAAHALVALAPLADLLGVGALARWANALEAGASVAHPPPRPEEEQG